MIVVQESSLDPTASYVVYSPVDHLHMKSVLLSGGDPEYVPLLPAGFCILPDGQMDRQNEGGPDGSIIIMGHQALIQPNLTQNNNNVHVHSVEMAKDIATQTVQRIKDAIGRRIMA